MISKTNATEACAERGTRSVSLAKVVERLATKLAEEGSWPAAGTLGYVETRLAELADLLSQVEEGTHGRTSTSELCGLAGVGRFPDSVEHDGRTFYFTGKDGTRFDDGRPVREYGDVDDARVWADASGRVFPE